MGIRSQRFQKIDITIQKIVWLGSFAFVSLTAKEDSFEPLKRSIAIDPDLISSGWGVLEEKDPNYTFNSLKNFPKLKKGQISFQYQQPKNLEKKGKDSSQSSFAQNKPAIKSLPLFSLRGFENAIAIGMFDLGEFPKKALIHRPFLTDFYPSSVEYEHLFFEEIARLETTFAKHQDVFITKNIPLVFLNRSLFSSVLHHHLNMSKEDRSAPVQNENKPFVHQKQPLVLKQTPLINLKALFGAIDQNCQELTSEEFTFLPESHPVILPKKLAFRIAKNFANRTSSTFQSNDFSKTSLELESDFYGYMDVKIAFEEFDFSEIPELDLTPIGLKEDEESKKALNCTAQTLPPTPLEDTFVTIHPLDSKMTTSVVPDKIVDSNFAMGIESFSHPTFHFQRILALIKESNWRSIEDHIKPDDDSTKTACLAFFEPSRSYQIPLPKIKIDLRPNQKIHIPLKSLKIALREEAQTEFLKRSLGFHVSKVDHNSKQLWDNSSILLKNEDTLSLNSLVAGTITTDLIEAKTPYIELTKSNQVPLHLQGFEKKDFDIFSSQSFFRYVEPQTQIFFSWNRGFLIDPIQLIFESCLKVKEVLFAEIQPSIERFSSRTFTHLKHLSLASFFQGKIQFEAFEKTLESFFFSSSKWTFNDFLSSVKMILVSQKFESTVEESGSDELISEHQSIEDDFTDQIVAIDGDKLHLKPKDIQTRFIVFHHPVHTMDKDASETTQKVFVHPKETDLFHQLAKIAQEHSTPFEWNQTKFTSPKHFPLNIPDETYLTEGFYKKQTLLTHVNLLYPGFIQVSSHKEPLLRLIEPRSAICTEPMNRFDLLTGEKFRSSINLELQKEVAFEPTPNEYQDIVSIAKIEIDIPESARKKLLKAFGPEDLKIVPIAPFSRTLFAISANRLVNEQVRHLHHMIDQFNQVHLDFQDVSKEFSVKAFATPLPHKEGYGIEIELTASDIFKPSLLEQEIIFVLDGSRNTPTKHFDIYKTGILRALKNLTPDTKFNIVFLGKTVQTLFKSAMSASQDKLLQGKRFLDGIYSYQALETGTLLKTLVDLAPEKTDSCLTTVVLLADSVVPQKQSIYYDEVQKLVKKVHGNFHLVTAALDTNYRKNLKFISLIGGGEDIEFNSSSSFVRKFSSFIRSYKYPYLMNIQITALGDGVSTLPSKNLCNPVFLNKPFKFYAISDNAEPFHILIQAQVEGRIIEVKKEVKAVQNEAIRSKIKGILDQKKAADAFENFVENRDLSKLDETNKQLDLFDIHF